MTIQEYSQIVANNIRSFMKLRDKTQTDIVNDLGISKSTLSSWVNAVRTPKIPTIDRLAEYFHCKRSDLMEIHDDDFMDKFVLLEQYSQLDEQQKKTLKEYASFLLSKKGD